MSLNWVEINRVLEEVPLEGCFLQNVRQTSYHHLIFEFYRPGRTIQLLICLERQSMRLHETARKIPSLSKPPRFTALLRSRIKGCRLEEAVQLGQERIIRMILVKGDARFKLYIRLWGGASNLILCDSSGTVLDAFSRRPSRNEIPGGIYCPEDLENRPPNREFTLNEQVLPEGETYNAALDRFYEQQEMNGELHLLKQKAERYLDQLENQYQAGLTGLKKRLEEYDQEEEFRSRGDTLMASLHLIRKGEKQFTPPGEPPIPLDPRKSPVENAQDYYKKAGKASRGRGMTQEEADLLEQKIAGIEKKRLLIATSSNPEEIRSLLPDTKEKAIPAGQEKAPGLSFRSGGFTLLAGRSAGENDALLRRYVRGNDYWLHTRDYPGGYIFIRTPRNKSVPLEVLLDAGNLAVFYSRGKKAGQADVYYTQVKYLRRPKEGKKGLVLPTKEKNLHIKLDEKRITRLREE